MHHLETTARIPHEEARARTITVAIVRWKIGIYLQWESVVSRIDWEGCANTGALFCSFCGVQPCCQRANPASIHSAILAGSLHGRSGTAAVYKSRAAADRFFKMIGDNHWWLGKQCMTLTYPDILWLFRAWSTWMAASLLVNRQQSSSWIPCWDCWEMSHHIEQIYTRIAYVYV